MATKNISITIEAYKRLAELKREKESFSDVINKITKKNDFENLLKLQGILKGKAGDEFRKSVIESRKKQEILHKERLKRLGKQWSN